MNISQKDVNTLIIFGGNPGRCVVQLETSQLELFAKALFAADSLDTLDIEVICIYHSI